MTPYQFIKQDFTSALLKNHTEFIDLQFYYNTLAARNNLSSVREMKEYHDIQDMFYDVTMSCNLQECKEQLEYFMVNAIGYGYATSDKKWILYFLAAWDIEHASILR